MNANELSEEANSTIFRVDVEINIDDSRKRDWEIIEEFTDADSVIESRRSGRDYNVEYWVPTWPDDYDVDAEIMAGWKVLNLIQAHLDILEVDHYELYPRRIREIDT